MQIRVINPINLIIVIYFINLSSPANTCSSYDFLGYLHTFSEEKDMMVVV